MSAKRHVRPRPHFLGALALAASLGSYSLPAKATVGYCAEVQNTADGFIALREGPDPATKELMRLKAGDRIFGPVSSASGDKLPDWIEVTAVEKSGKGNASGEEITITGFVRSRFVKEFTCP